MDGCVAQALGALALVGQTPRNRSLTTGSEACDRNGRRLCVVSALEDSELSWTIGNFAGVWAVFQFSVTSREQGKFMREHLARLYTTMAVPLIFVCGGASMFCGVLDSVRCLNLRTGEWQDTPPMPTARRLCAATSTGGKMYVVGGEIEVHDLWPSDAMTNRYRQLGTTERYNPFREEWETLPPMPTARAGCVTVAAGGKVYVAGGRVGETVRSTFERLDLATQRWERLPDMPTARSGCGGVVYEGKVHILGGKGSTGNILDTVERFDPVCGWWHRLPPMPTPRSAFALGVLSNRLFVAGGFDGSVGVDVVESFDLRTGSWSSEARMTTWHIGAAAAVAHGRLYVLGGKTGADLVVTCECFDPEAKGWSTVPPLVERRVYCAGAALIGCS